MSTQADTSYLDAGTDPNPIDPPLKAALRALLFGCLGRGGKGTPSGNPYSWPGVREALIALQHDDAMLALPRGEKGPNPWQHIVIVLDAGAYKSRNGNTYCRRAAFVIRTNDATVATVIDLGDYYKPLDVLNHVCAWAGKTTAMDRNTWSGRIRGEIRVKPAYLRAAIKRGTL